MLETLESAKNQTYQNIELIVTDDCSSDDTVAVCEKWIKENQERFSRTELITVSNNKGISANCNRGIKTVKGLWIKIIAGDDALLFDAVENIVKIGNENPSAEVILTLVETYNNVFTKDNLISIRPQNWQSIPAYAKNVTSKIQLEYLLNGGFHNTPGLFLKSKVYEEIGWYEEKYSLIEDIPFYLKLGLNNKKIVFVSVATTKYRKHQDNLTSVYNKIIASYTYQCNNAVFNASLKYGKNKFIINSCWNTVMIYFIIKFGNKGRFSKFLNNIRLKYQPIRFYNLLHKLKVT